METLVLKKPVTINGEETTELKYDLENLSGGDVQLACKELGKRGIIVTFNETDTNYHAMLFAIASGISFEDMTLLGIKDYNSACNAVRDFFLED